ncbi:hypothetical protein ECDEC6C_0530 [Escherichia coli DEC6C]|nr:hypothetical protein ECDEC6C_0530 [Escherichia coli DEC6C]
MTCKTHCLTGDDFAAFARFNRAIDFHLAFGKMSMLSAWMNGA